MIKVLTHIMIFYKYVDQVHPFFQKFLFVYLEVAYPTISIQGKCVILLKNIAYLEFGNEKQKRAYNVIHQLNIMKDLKSYSPILCGTIPLGIDTASSDLDMIMEVHHLQDFAKIIHNYYGSYSGFRLKNKTIRGKPIVKANFTYQEFEFELFGQSQPVAEQYAYLHMIIEKYLLDEHPLWKSKIIALKEEGLKTEQAFCAMLGLTGDPYEALIDYGRKRQII